MDKIGPRRMINSEKNGKVALFWDESYLWGLLAYHTLRGLGVDFKLLTGSEIRSGALNRFDALFVPGGWAGDKMEALGTEGAMRIRSFVESGGGYLGICGGAGLALTHESGLDLAPIGRLPTRARVPSFSGLIGVEQAQPAHAMWEGIAEGTPFHAWWPGQFSLGDDTAVQVLARYREPVPGVSFVTDLPVKPEVDWPKWEASYGINLDPARLRGEPAVIETSLGEGRVILSYLHFDTEGDPGGNNVLVNLITYLAGGAKPAPAADSRRTRPAGGGSPSPEPGARIACEIHETIAALIDFGRHNFLWRWRTPWVLQWRRGVRGIEYSTLFALSAEICCYAAAIGNSKEDTSRLKRLRTMTRSFAADARKLLMLERFAMSRGPLSPLKISDPEIKALRKELFSSTRRCGGRYREIVELMDRILLPLLKQDLTGKRRLDGGVK